MDPANALETRVDEFRSVEDMPKPDLRQGLKTAAEHHELVSHYPLSDAVPDDIRIQWETARNLWLCAWYVWRFYPVADRHAYGVLEMALRIKLGHDKEEHPPGLKILMTEAIKRGLLHDQHIEYHTRMRRGCEESHRDHQEMAREFGWPLPAPLPILDPQDYCRLLAKTFPKLRNMYAHGSPALDPTISLTFSLCRDLINQLFRPVPTPLAASTT